jgi:N-methylhydantoinase A
VTDAAVVLGWLSAGRPLASGVTLEADRAAAAVQRVADEAGLTRERCAEGIVEVATAAMVRALRRVSVERGIDPRRLTLVAFGGAGPLFACRMAAALGSARALIPPHAGVLSALGLAAAPAKIEALGSVHRAASTLDAADFAAVVRGLEARVLGELPAAALTCHADCRYPGQGYELAVEAENPARAADAFHTTHAERFGHADETRDVEIVNVRVTGVVRGTALSLSERTAGPSPAAAERYDADALPAGAVLAGPCTIDAGDCTVRVEDGWTASVHPTGALVLERD